MLSIYSTEAINRGDARKEVCDISSTAREHIELDSFSAVLVANESSLHT
jgi:hypothetical protein